MQNKRKTEIRLARVGKLRTLACPSFGPRSFFTCSQLGSEEDRPSLDARHVQLCFVVVFFPGGGGWMLYQYGRGGQNRFGCPILVGIGEFAAHSSNLF